MSAGLNRAWERVSACGPYEMTGKTKHLQSISLISELPSLKGLYHQGRARHRADGWRQKASTAKARPESGGMLPSGPAHLPQL